MQLSSQETFELSKNLKEISVSIENFRIEKWKELSQEELQHLENAEYSILNASSEALTSAIDLVLEETEWSIQQLKELTESANNTLKQIASIHKAVKISTEVVGLAVAIISQNTGSIAKNAKALYDTIKEE